MSELISRGPRQHEYVVPADEVIITRTDLKGRITYANDAFLVSTGYSLDEVMGTAHSIVRHPTMPRAAFSDLWQCLKAGKSWSGIVKNHRKDGGFYWVKAYVTPVKQLGEVVAYMSVRVRASDHEINSAIAAYRQLDHGTEQTPAQARQRAAAARVQLNHGRVLRKALAFRAMDKLLALPAGQRMWGYCAGLSLLVALATFGRNLGLAETWVQWAAVLGMLLPWIEAVYMRNQVFGPLNRLQMTGNRVLGGEALARFEEAGDATVRGLASSLNQMSMRTAGVLRDVEDRVRHLTDLSARMQASSEGLSATVEQQAASIATVAQSVTQVSGGVNQTTTQSQSVRSLADTALEQVREGHSAADAVASAFEGVSKTSERTAGLLAVIDGISLQTRILAINAHIEAAHAADSGKGFAVIAKEVRALSERVSTAVQEVHAINSEAAAEIESANATVKRLRDAITVIEKSCKEVGTLSRTVAETNAEQNTALHEVTNAMREMNAATQQNAMTADVSATVAEEVRMQTSRLREAFAN